MEDFEIEVYDSELYYSGKLNEWLDFRAKRFEFHPNDSITRYRFAEALIQNNRNKDALKYLQTFHNDEPENDDLHDLILVCLHKQNLEKKDFTWKIEPFSLCLNHELELLILQKFKEKRKRKSKLNDIYLDLIVGDLLEFDETELMNYLRKSQYFMVEEIELL